MKIELPRNMIKDRLGYRFTFIGARISVLFMRNNLLDVTTEPKPHYDFSCSGHTAITYTTQCYRNFLPK